MESDVGRKYKLYTFVYEFLCTGLILYAINVSYGNPIAIIFTIFAAVLICGPITGAHFNPAVSTAVLISHTEPVKALPMYFLMVFAEICGAFFGTFIAYLSLMNTEVTDDYEIGSVHHSHLVKMVPRV